jgi:hypothetical protein
VTEVMVNGTRGVWVERDGRLEETSIRFSDPEEILVLIERLVAPRPLAAGSISRALSSTAAFRTARGSTR